MTCKSVQNIVMFSIIATIALTTFAFENVFAEESEGYNMIGGVTPVLTFTFRDGVETHTFPVFNMGENFVDDAGVSFSVEGTVTKSPLLHKAMDEAYKYRLSNNAFDFQFKYFDVNANFVKEGNTVLSLDYRNCRIGNYNVETLDSNDYESYLASVGFAVVDKISFVCSGLNSNNKFVMPSEKYADFGSSGFKFANDMRTVVTFNHGIGSEKIEFPVFNLVSAYKESSENVVAEFEVEGVLDYYPLLYKAIDNSRVLSGNSYSSNVDFDAVVEFTNGSETLRGFEFTSCIVSDAKITTKTDKEEGFTKKSGFVIVNTVRFTCSGINPINNNYDSLRGDAPSWQTTHVSNEYVEPIQNTDGGLDVFATFTFAEGTEKTEFSMFTQSGVLTSTEKIFVKVPKKTTVDSYFVKKSTYPTLELRGIVGDYPILYNALDENLKVQGVKGTGLKKLLDIDVDIVYNGEVIRGFNYSHCRAIDYTVETNPNSEESYVKNKFALETILDFECQGYTANNPAYDAMFKVEKAKTESTSDLRKTDQWRPGFYVE